MKYFWRCVIITVNKVDLRNKRERVCGSMPDHEEDSSPPAPTWWRNLNVAAKFLEALHKHPFASNPTFLTSRSWFDSSIGSLHFHKYFSNPLRCLGGTVVAIPLPLSLHQVLRKAIPLRASSLIFFDAWRYPSNGAPTVMKQFTVKRSCNTWLISATYQSLDSGYYSMITISPTCSAIPFWCFVGANLEIKGIREDYPFLLEDTHPCISL